MPDVDPWLPARLRGLAELLAGEAEIEAAVLLAVEAWLQRVREVVLGEGDGGLSAAGEVPPPQPEQWPLAEPVWVLAMEELILPEIGELFSERFLQVARTSVVAAQPYVQAYLDEVASRLVLFPHSAFEELRPELAEAISEGETMDQIRSRIEAILDFDRAADAPGTRDHDRTKRLRGRIRSIERQLDDPETPPDEIAELRAERRDLYEELHEAERRWQWKARRIARTETIGAYNGGAYEGAVFRADEQGLDMAKRWLATLDTRVRPTHLAAHEQLVPLHDEFAVGDAMLAFPGDPRGPGHEVIQCRCTFLVHELDELDDDEREALDNPPADLATISAGGTMPDEPTLPNGWRGPLAALDIRTGDGRILQTPPDGLRLRQPPLSLLWQQALGHGHEGAVVAGRADRAWIETAEDGRTYVMGEGPFDLDGEAGAEAARLLGEGLSNGVSVDIDDARVEERWYAASTGLPVDVDSMPEDRFWEAWESGEIEPVAVFVDWRLMGATLTPQPAFDEARLQPVYDYVPAAVDVALAASAAAVRVYDRGDFADPYLTELTPLQVTDDGRVFGHLAGWGTCHTGFPGQCVTAPHSRTDYALFHVGAVQTSDGPLGVGKITLGTGHADPKYGVRAAAEHYDHTGTAVAVVRAGEDEFGVWVAGRLLDDVTPQQVETLMRSPLSGDWRRVDGNLELVGALAVNVPGFPVPRTVAASGELGEQVSLVAAGVAPLAGIRRRRRRAAAAAGEGLDYARLAREIVREQAALAHRSARADELAARVAVVATEQDLTAHLARLDERIAACAR
ncbi:phage minor head protein [Nonomuraea rubra]|uniref:phage minor head protein n=1 Tax=Nonomuraea rubra TaxID=46180 RepID=UPI0033DE843F